MAAGTWKIYSKAKKYIGNGTIDLGTTTMRMALLRNSATAKGIHTVSTRSTWASIKSTEISARGGYAAHGRALGPAAGHWTAGASAKQWKFSYTTAGLVFTASGSALNNIRFAVIMASVTATTGRLLCFCTLSSSNFTISSPNTLTILPAATGVFTLA